MSLFAFTEAEALEIATRRRLPCFAYRLEIARERYRELRSALPERAILAYAVKANPARELVSAFAESGASFDCASIGELERARGELARHAPVPGSRVLFAGPGKSLEELRLALAMGARIEADGIEDIERTAELLSEFRLAKPRPADGDTPLAVSLRVHPAAGVSEGAKIIGGSGPSAFGVDEEGLSAFLKEAARFKLVRITGLQVFAASNERDYKRLLANHRAAFALGERLQRETGAVLDLIDLGGGLGIPYAEGEDELDIGAFGRGLSRLLEENPWFSGRIVVEPGRWLAGPCGVYLARVVRTKTSRGVNFAVLEGGLNHLLRPLLTGQSFPAAAPFAGKARGTGQARDARGPRVATTLAGPLCTSLDRLGEVRLPPLKAGDLVMLGQAGAYGATEAMTAFLSHPEAEEYWIEESPAAR
jgi:diaminopimelate decarboxylase